MKSRGGFTLVELLLASSIGALVLVLLFRFFALALAEQEDTQKKVAAYQQARMTLQWIAGAIQAAAEVRGGTRSTVELAGTFEPARGVECRGFFIGEMSATRSAVLYERRRTGCREGGTSAGGEVVAVSDPTVSIALLGFRYLQARGATEPDLRRVQLIEVAVGVDADRDGRTDYRLVQLVGRRVFNR